MRLQLLITVLCTMPFVVSCGDSPPPVEPDPATDEVFELVASLSIDDINTAYTRLDGFAYTTEVLLEELDTDDEVAASAGRTVRRVPTADGVEETLLDEDSLGSFSSSASFEGLMRPINPLSAVLPDEPAYVRMRTRDRYAYEMRADTSLNGNRIRVAQATLHQESADEQPIRYARYYVDDSSTIVGIAVLRLTTSALFDETSLVNLWLEPGPDDSFLPRRSQTQTVVHTPGNEPRHMRLTQTVRDITAIE